jgi:hypothetical protein
LPGTLRSTRHMRQVFVAHLSPLSIAQHDGEVMSRILGGRPVRCAARRFTPPASYALAVRLLQPPVSFPQPAVLINRFVTTSLFPHHGKKFRLQNPTQICKFKDFTCYVSVFHLTFRNLPLQSSAVLLSRYQANLLFALSLTADKLIAFS